MQSVDDPNSARLKVILRGDADRVTLVVVGDERGIVDGDDGTT